MLPCAAGKSGKTRMAGCSRQHLCFWNHKKEADMKQYIRKIGKTGVILMLLAAVIQCQLVKRFEKQINGLNIGIKSYLEVNLETNGVYHAI